MHLAGDHAFQGRVTDRAIKFFLLQAVAITFEDLVIYIVKHLPLVGGTKPTSGEDDGFWVKAVARVIGYCWVVLWLCFSLPIWVDGLSVTGLSNTDRGRFAQLVWNAWERWVQ